MTAAEEKQKPDLCVSKSAKYKLFYSVGGTLVYVK